MPDLLKPLRYVVTRWAHDRNPYSSDSEEWAGWNKGFIENAMPTIKMPSVWGALYWSIAVGCWVLAGAVGWRIGKWLVS